MSEQRSVKPTRARAIAALRVALQECATAEAIPKQGPYDQGAAEQARRIRQAIEKVLIAESGATT